ncbi:hypothetical protein [Methylohalobius crimeensis]|uniref:hypothetical protein n=1 Tax=Methylohalobius crimeensis TaxID=244365 RepID=UPI0003B6F980|nr:hypothetical protein [Methylohalobius crimeensis]
MREKLEQEKDYFWYIIGAVVVAVGIAMWVVKSSEHGKYVTSEQAIQEDSSFSAYR